MPKLTRTQLDALAMLHKEGAQWPMMHPRYGGDRHTLTTRYARRTLAALVAARAARWATDHHGVMPHVLPVLHTYADGAGTWHVEIPAMLPISTDQHAAVARAVIAGEVWQRNRQSYVDDWRPRVEYVSRAARYRSARTSELIRTYREA